MSTTSIDASAPAVAGPATENDGIARLQSAIAPLRQTLLGHSVYERLGSLPALRCFMEHHVFAVYDFMSLLKALQQRLTSVSVPWVPTAQPSGARLINEIVLGEETDEDGRGGFTSHYHLYLNAMRQVGADTQVMEGIVQRLADGAPIRDALVAGQAPAAAQAFVDETFQVIEAGDVVALTANFTFGREDLLPEVFHQVVQELDRESGSLSQFQYYLQRHIELDGDHHGPLAHRLLSSLCGDSPEHWARATEAAVNALQARLRLWDGIAAAVDRLS